MILECVFIKPNLVIELPEQQALLIMDVFKGQMTDTVLAKLEENNVALIKVPANFTYLFQPLDVQGSVNIAAKQFLKQKFTHGIRSKLSNKSIREMMLIQLTPSSN